MVVVKVLSCLIVLAITPPTLVAEDEGDPVPVPEDAFVIATESSIDENGIYRLEFNFKSSKTLGVDNSALFFVYGREIPRQISAQKRSGISPDKDGSLESKVTITIELIEVDDEQAQQMELRIVNDGAAMSRVFDLENTFDDVEDLVTAQIEGGVLKPDERITLLEIDRLPVDFELETDHPAYNP